MLAIVAEYDSTQYHREEAGTYILKEGKKSPINYGMKYRYWTT